MHAAVRIVAKDKPKMSTAIRLQELFGDVVSPDYTFDGTGVSWDRTGRGVYTKLYDRANGRFLPVFENELDLRALRQSSWLLAERVPMAQSIIRGLQNYTIASGFDYKITHTNPTVQQLCSRVFKNWEANSKWAAHQERDSFASEIIDGEFIAELCCDGPDVSLEPLEGDNLTEPYKAKELDDFFEHDCATDWTFGVCTRENRFRPLRYHIVRNDSATDWDALKPCDVVHWTRNVPVKAKRGFGDFYRTHRYLTHGDKLLINTAIGAQTQAAIAYIVEHAEGARKDSVMNMINGLKNVVPNAYDPVTGDPNVRTKKIVAGQRIDIPFGAKYHAALLGSNASNIYIEVMEALLRVSGTMYHFPEHMLTGFAGNNNMASGLVAESPFVQGRMAEQAIRSARLKELIVKVLRKFFSSPWAKQRGYCWEDVEAGLDVTISAPEIVSRDIGQLTTAIKTQMELGLLSPRTASQKLTLDYENEQKNIADDKAKTQPVGPDGQPAPTPAPAGSGVLANSNRVQFKRARKNVAEIVNDFTSGATTRVQAEVLLSAQGFGPEEVQKLLNEPTQQVAESLIKRMVKRRSEALRESIPRKRFQIAKLFEWEEHDHPRGSDGKFIGKLSGVDLSGWNPKHATAKWAINKIGKLEQFAKAGKWDMFESALSKPGGSTLNTYQKTVLKAQANLAKLKVETVSAPPANTEPKLESPELIDGSKWKKVGSQLGSVEGGTYVAPDGTKYYVKHGDDKLQARNEVLASKLYQACGGNALTVDLVEINGKVGVCSKWDDSAKQIDWASSPDLKNQAAKDYALHAWLNNWDCVGFISDQTNIKAINGVPVLMDAGGSLESKAQGGIKPFGTNAQTYNDLINPKINPSTTSVFGGMTPAQHIEAIGKLKNISDQNIADLVTKFGNKETATSTIKTLMARRDAILQMGEMLKETTTTPVEAVPAADTPVAKARGSANAQLYKAFGITKAQYDEDVDTFTPEGWNMIAKAKGYKDSMDMAKAHATLVIDTTNAPGKLNKLDLLAQIPNAPIKDQEQAAKTEPVINDAFFKNKLSDKYNLDSSYIASDGTKYHMTALHEIAKKKGWSGYIDLTSALPDAKKAWASADSYETQDKLAAALPTKDEYDTDFAGASTDQANAKINAIMGSGSGAKSPVPDHGFSSDLIGDSVIAKAEKIKAFANAGDLQSVKDLEVYSPKLQDYKAQVIAHMTGAKPVTADDLVEPDSWQNKPEAIAASVKMTIPPPTIITSPANQDKAKLCAKIYEAAKTGSIDAVNAVKVNMNAVSSQAKKVAAYKLAVLAALGSGGTVDPAHVMPPSTPAAATAPASTDTVKPVKLTSTVVKGTVKPELFPAAPEFASSNKANVEANNAIVAKALELAKAGDLDGLDAQSATLPPSNKLKTWHASLASMVKEQTQPQVRLDGSYAEFTAQIGKLPPAGAKKVGYWSVVKDLGGVPSGLPTGEFKSVELSYLKDHQLLKTGLANYSKLPPEQATAIYHYTGGGSGPINQFLRFGTGGDTNAKLAGNAVKAMKAASHDLPSGLKLSRRYPGSITGLKVGEVIAEKGILSTSTDETEWSGDVQFQITTGPGCKGLSVAKYSNYQHEDEILLPPNTRLLVTKIVSNHTHVVHAVMLPTVD